MPPSPATPQAGPVGGQQNYSLSPSSGSYESNYSDSGSTTYRGSYRGIFKLIGLGIAAILSLLGWASRSVFSSRS